MESIILFLQEWGLTGLIIAAFTESFCSPILPDVLLIPMALAQPHLAIYYGVVATVVSVLGGFVGYWIGAKWGMPVMHKVVPDKYAEKIQSFANGENVAWAIFLAAMSPIPYKCISISAGAFRVKWSVFVLASLFGRAKRFFLEALAIYYFGNAAVIFFKNSRGEILLVSVLIIVMIVGGLYFYRRQKKARIQPQ